MAVRLLGRSVKQSIQSFKLINVEKGDVAYDPVQRTLFLLLPVRWTDTLGC
jgi:hypothetical protein